MPLMKRGNLSSQCSCTSSEFLHRDNLLQIPQWHGIWGLLPMHGKLYIHQQSGIMPHSPLSPQWDDDAATTLQRRCKSNQTLMHVPRCHRSQQRLNTHLVPRGGNRGSLQTTSHQPPPWSLLYTSHSSTVTKDLSYT